MFEKARNMILDSFDDRGCYSHEVPFTYSNFIDGMAWIGLLCGACHVAGDDELIKKTERYLSILLRVGKDARNFAPKQVNPEWKKSENIDGLFYLEKPQSYAGPFALQFAIQCGAKLDNPFDKEKSAEFFADWSNLYGYLLNIPWFGKKYMRQHLNTIMVACLVSRKKPGESLEWLYKSNPFYAYIAGVNMDVEYPPDTVYSDEKIIEHKDIQEISKREPSPWVWKQWPTKECIGNGTILKKYTPVAYLTAYYLQKGGVN
jgi:hypothetical protein